MVTVQWLDCRRQDATAVGQAGLVFESKPLPRWEQASDIYDGHLGLRMAAGHDDSLDIRARSFHLPNLEPRRPVHPVPKCPEGMFWTRSDGSGKPQPLTQSKNPQYPWSFTSNGKRLAFMGTKS